MIQTKLLDIGKTASEHATESTDKADMSIIETTNSSIEDKDNGLPTVIKLLIHVKIMKLTQIL